MKALWLQQKVNGQAGDKTYFFIQLSHDSPVSLDTDYFNLVIFTVKC